MKSHKITFDSNQPRWVAAPRHPEPSEKAELLTFLLDSIESGDYGIDEEERANALALIDSANIAVYDTYTTVYRPGYTGKLMSVVWPTDPADHEVFIWSGGALVNVEGRMTS